jgi:cholesterol transport system auxiliary component
MKRFLLLAIVLLTGCATPRTQAPAAVYDFGAQRLAAGGSGVSDDKPLRASIWVPDVQAPVWLDNTGILYRLAYHDLAQVHAYGSSRWAATPAILLTQRIRSRIAMVNDAGVISAAEGARTNYMLGLELEEFSQIFDTTDSSRAVIKLRASLIDRRTRLLLSQRNFSIEQPSLAPNAPGGVRALTKASDNLIGSLIEWLAEELPEGTSVPISPIPLSTLPALPTSPTSPAR